jgi:hypothetical protein
MQAPIGYAYDHQKQDPAEDEALDQARCSHPARTGMVCSDADITFTSSQANPKQISYLIARSANFPRNAWFQESRQLLRCFEICRK